MLTLHARGLALSAIDIKGTLIAKMTCNDRVPAPLRSKYAFLYHGQCNEIPQGFAAILCRNGCVPDRISGTNHIELSPEQHFLAEGDVIRVGPDLRVNVIYRRSASSNAMLVTEQCNSFCVMCSQPPKAHDDSYLIDDWIRAIPYIDESCPELTITGGEPTLMRDKLFELLEVMRAQLPTTGVHILTNGRNFKEIELARRLASVNHPDLMLGIPLYSDVASIHDFVVQADGAFDETIDGIINLKRYGQRIELRIVIHAETYERLPKLAEFIARNLQFVDQVSLMGLELTGFARANLDAVWIDPFDYQDQLASAVDTLLLAKVRPIIFNHQLCVLRPELRQYAVKSISDWKREYMPECEWCIEAHRGCGGFFSSAMLRYSEHIKPLQLAS